MASDLRKRDLESEGGMVSSDLSEGGRSGSRERIDPYI
jgi:hypothetical protein